jgi:dihydropteroate synthase
MKQKVQYVGILNTTLDSYWDGGKYTSVESAVERAGELIRQGTDIIEVGGESTGPGSSDVEDKLEIERTIPVIKAIKEAHPSAQISIDTYKSRVAEDACKAGATMINDVTAGRADAKIFSVAAKYNAGLVLMYAKDPSPRTTRDAVAYDDVIETIMSFLKERVRAALQAGVKEEQIIVDPGLGHFVSSDPKYSFEIITRLNEIVQLGYPVFISPSRKSFLAGNENLATKDRLPGTIVASAIAVGSGASYMRTHDVLEVRRGCEIAQGLSLKK